MFLDAINVVIMLALAFFGWCIYQMVILSSPALTNDIITHSSAFIIGVILGKFLLSHCPKE